MMDIDLIKHAPWIGLTAFGLVFGIIFLAGALDKAGRWNYGVLTFLAAQAVFVPLGVWTTLWCYAHGDRVDAMKDSWTFDMRIYWPFFLIVEGCLVGYFLRSYCSWAARACRLLQRAHLLLAQGRTGEADACYRKGKRLLDNNLRPKT